MSHKIIQGDCIEGLRTLPDASVHCCVTSPPYWGLRDYGHAGQIGLEDTPEAYVARMVEVFREVRRVLRDDGTCWVNLGDSYAANAATSKKIGESYRGSDTPTLNQAHQCRVSVRGGEWKIKAKDLVGIPWRVAFALQADGWWLRQDIIWHKPNPMPESVRDRCTKAHEYVFLLTKSERYFYDAEAIKQDAKYPHDKRRPMGSQGAWQIDGRKRGENGGGVAYDHDTEKSNRRSVWTITTKPYKGAHFATMPPDLAETCLLAGTSAEGCCSVCGAPRERVVDRKRTPTRPGADTKVTGDSLVDGNRDPQRHITTSTTTGWQPTCPHTASTVPCVVLDPFGGSGTTLAVAAEHGRSGIACELNPEYIILAEQRIAKAKAKAPLFVA